MLFKLSKLNWNHDLVYKNIILLKFKLKLTSEIHLNLEVYITHRVELSFYSKRRCQKLKSLKSISNLSHLSPFFEISLIFFKLPTVKTYFLKPALS